MSTVWLKSKGAESLWHRPATGRRTGATTEPTLCGQDVAIDYAISVASGQPSPVCQRCAAESGVKPGQSRGESGVPTTDLDAARRQRIATAAAEGAARAATRLRR